MYQLGGTLISKIVTRTKMAVVISAMTEKVTSLFCDVIGNVAF